MKGWIEIFRTGKHTSAAGQTREWTEADLDKMIGAYDSKTHEAPLVVGHPKANAPAWGWVEQLKKVAGTLFMKTGQVDPQFAEMVEQGRFKKRSISVYPAGSLRHVGFLGAQPPSIKGLSDIAFSDAEADTYEFSETEANMPTIEELQTQLNAANEATEAAKADAKKYKAQAEKSDEDFAEQQKKNLHDQISSFVDDGIKSGSILPAWKDMGLANFLEELESSTETFEFAEGKTESPAEWFKTFLASFSEHPLFKEMTKPEGDDKAKGGKGDFAEDEAVAKEIAGIDEE